MAKKRLLLTPWQAVLLLSAYIGVVLNAAVFLRRTADLNTAYLTIFAELGLVFAFTGLLISLADLTGKWLARISIVLLLTISVLASYYMTLFNVVIGYGVVQAVLTTDVDLSKEAVGFGLFLWFVALALVPMVLWWRYLHIRRSKHASWWLRFQQVGGKVGLVVLCATVFGVLAQHVNAGVNSTDAVGQDVGKASLAAHTYVPSNWLAGLGMSASSAWDSWTNKDQKTDPAEKFQYSLNSLAEDAVVVFVIGESARSSNFGLLGYERPTTPLLAAEKNLVAFNAASCDTSTKLSLACMFVRPQAVVDRGLQAPKILEETVFSVFKKLGFSVELFAMQSEVWFYNSIKPDFYKIREVIAAEPAHRGKAVLDSILVAELEAALAKHVAAQTKGPHAIVLHTKGSHFSYTSRYPREFARYLPECSGVDGACTKQQLINSYDNSLLYTDTFLHSLMRSLAGKKAVMVYTSDHGESIDENQHFHATPKPLAPPEQLDVPLLFWASDPYLNANPANKKAFEQLQLAAKSQNTAKTSVGHANLFDSMLGCLGITSNNGGIDDKYNLCH